MVNGLFLILVYKCDSNKVLDINGETYVVSAIDEEGDITGLINITEDGKLNPVNGSDKISMIFSEQGESFFNDDELIYKNDRGGYSYVEDCDNGFDIYGEHFYVADTDENGNITAMYARNNETGEVRELAYENVWAAPRHYNMCLKAENGDIVYNVDGNVHYVKADDVSYNEDGTLEFY